MKKKLDEIRVRIVNMRSANFTEIRESLEGQKYNFLKLSFCDKEEKVCVSSETEWTTKRLISTYHRLEPQIARFSRPFIICPIYNAYRKLKSQLANIYLFVTDYKVKNGNYGGSCDGNQTYFYLSLYGITDYLRSENIRLANFVQIAIYRDVLRYLCGKRIAHNKTKKCIFDTHSKERLPLITESCAKPKICRKCRNEIEDALEESGKPTEYLTETEKALRRLKKGLYYRIKDHINNHPWRALLITIGFTIITGVAASFICDLIKWVVLFFRN